MFDKLFNETAWAMDGTFDIVTYPFVQLYTIGFVKSHHVIPVVYAFLKNKRRSTYINLFGLKNRFNHTSVPQQILMGFEIAAIQAVMRVFPGIKFRDAFFTWDNLYTDRFKV